jgi:hypothetical protein
VPDPRETILSLADCIASDGAIWISTPNAQSFLFDSLQGYARDADFPRHRQIFSRKGLVELLQESGFTLKFHSPPRVNAILNFFASMRSLGKVNSRHKFLLGFLKSFWALMLYLISSQSRRFVTDPEIIAVARKKTNAFGNSP